MAPYSVTTHPGPCIHYICLPQTLHSLYLVSYSTQDMKVQLF
ncbi:unnamed protein product [Staurois parvus]|uniref:Uncharacterized protein n=1 Tax=Staurois parvus TaxID=386267 RepID=A0ABN9HAZ6_9NEOB|nr:unnamed protein product [Staurois parvus]